MIGVVQLTLLAWCTFALGCAAASSLLYPALRPRLRRLGPASRARVLSWIAAAPFAAATTLAATCFVPSLATRLLHLSDHCTQHDELHAHFCWVHPAPSAGSVAGWLLVGAAVMPLVAIVAFDVVRLGRAWQRSLVLVRLAERSRNRLLPGAPVAFTVGLFRPHAIIGATLAAELPAPLLDAVLAHERAHVARQDNLRKAAAGLLARLHAPHTRALLLADLDFAFEQACDREAAFEAGDPLIVADAIVAAERLRSSCAPLPVLTSAFGAGSVQARVEALVRRDEAPVDDERPIERWLGLLAACAFVAAVPLHDALEDLVSLLGH